MSDVSFDALSRSVAGAVSRRASLVTLGAVGLAVLAGHHSAEAKKTARRKTKKKARKKCKKQAEECSALIEGRCDDDPDCLEDLACCEFAGRCDAAELVDCLFFGGNSGTTLPSGLRD